MNLSSSYLQETKHNEEQLAQFFKTVPRESYTIATKWLGLSDVSFEEGFIPVFWEVHTGLLLNIAECILWVFLGGDPVFNRIQNPDFVWTCDAGLRMSS